MVRELWLNCYALPFAKALRSNISMKKSLTVLALLLISSCATSDNAPAGRIEKNECEKTVDTCRSIQEADIFAARVCADKLTKCEGEPKFQGEAWPNFYELKAKLIKVADTTIIPRHLSREQCEAGMKWGFERLKHESDPMKRYHRSITMSHLPRNLFGKYDTQDQCEEARILNEGKWDVSPSCEQRYTGRKISEPVYLLKYLDNLSSESLTFSARATCEKAQKEGFRYVARGTRYNNYRELNILPAGKSGEPRFVGTCKQITRDVCRPNAEPYNYAIEVGDEIY